MGEWELCAGLVACGVLRFLVPAACVAAGWYLVEWWRNDV